MKNTSTLSAGAQAGLRDGHSRMTARASAEADAHTLPAAQPPRGGPRASIRPTASWPGLAAIEWEHPSKQLRVKYSEWQIIRPQLRSTRIRTRPARLRMGFLRTSSTVRSHFLQPPDRSTAFHHHAFDRFQRSTKLGLPGSGHGTFLVSRGVKLLLYNQPLNATVFSSVSSKKGLSTAMQGTPATRLILNRRTPVRRTRHPDGVSFASSTWRAGQKKRSGSGCS